MWLSKLIYIGMYHFSDMNHVHVHCSPAAVAVADPSPPSPQLPGLRCGAPVWAGAMTFVYLLVLTGLFLNFYMRSYRGSAKRPVGEPKPPSAPSDVSGVKQKTPRPLPLMWKMLQSHGLGCFHRND